MHPVLLIMTALTSLFHDAISVFPSNKQVTLTLHAYDLSWNAAQVVCDGSGGNLFTEDSEERHTVFNAYKADSSWQDTVKANHVWIGLHSPTTIQGLTNGEWTYGWTNCYKQNTTLYSHWQASQPKKPGTQRCAVADKTSGDWITVVCDADNNMFVCQTESADCTYKHVVGEPDTSISTSYAPVTTTTVDEATCKSACLTEQNDNTNCWAVHYDGALTTDNCVLYFTSSPFLFDPPAAIATSSKDFYIKQCYSIAIETTAPSNSGDNDSDPVEGCTALIDYTVSTTTTPAPSSTTIASTTTITLGTTTPAPSSTTIASTTTTTISTAASLTPTTSTSTTASTTISTSATTTSGTCSCGCADLTEYLSNVTSSDYASWANLTVEEKVEKLVEKLTVDKMALSATVRRKTSAYDGRTTSKGIGVVGLAFLSVLLAAIVTSDAVKFVRFIAQRGTEDINLYTVTPDRY